MTLISLSYHRGTAFMTSQLNYGADYGGGACLCCTLIRMKSSTNIQIHHFTSRGCLHADAAAFLLKGRVAHGIGCGIMRLRLLLFYFGGASSARASVLHWAQSLCSTFCRHNVLFAAAAFALPCGSWPPTTWQLIHHHTIAIWFNF